MAAGILPKPGSEYGPCEGTCNHRDCAETRQTAAKVCEFCKMPIGYGVRFYDDVAGICHANCLEDYLDKVRL